MAILTLSVSALLALVVVFWPSDENMDTMKRIEDKIEVNPSEALESLKSLDIISFSKKEEMYYNFLLIKAMDKAYIKHTSDSIIKQVIDYSSCHRKQIPYAEALYYGGRVYSDIGDYPTALSCFNKAILSLDSAYYDTGLMSKLYSQKGRLLTTMGLHEEAIPNIKEAVRLTRLDKDSINLVYDLQLLGITYLRSKKYIEAEEYINEALGKSHHMPDSHIAKSLMYMAAIKEGQDDLNSAQHLIQGIPDRVRPIARNSALAYSAEIYFKLQNLDSAYDYSKRLIESPDQNNKSTAFRLLISPQLRHRLPIDTLIDYVEEYASLLEQRMDHNDNQMVLTQQAMFNYQLQDVRREKAEAKSSALMVCCISAGFFILLLLLVLLLVRDRKNRKIIELQNALVKTREISARMLISSGQNSDGVGTRMTQAGETIAAPDSNATPQDNLKSGIKTSNLQQQLRDELLQLAESPNYTYSVSSIILQSEVYSKLQDCIDNNRTISPDSGIWKELEEVVLQCSPKFKTNLRLLTEGKLTSYDLQTALLIKCGISPKHMIILLGRSKGAIVSRRDSISIRIFGMKLGTKVIDNIIRLL